MGRSKRSKKGSSSKVVDFTGGQKGNRRKQQQQQQQRKKNKKKGKDDGVNLEKMLDNVNTNRYQYSSNDVERLQKKRRGEDLYLVFNEDDRSEFISGFHQRREKRRSRAVALDEKEYKTAKQGALQKHREQEQRVIDESGVLRSNAAKLVAVELEKHKSGSNDDTDSKTVKFNTESAVVSVTTSVQPILESVPMVVPTNRDNEDCGNEEKLERKKKRPRSGTGGQSSKLRKYERMHGLASATMKFGVR